MNSSYRENFGKRFTARNRAARPDQLCGSRKQVLNQNLLSQHGAFLISKALNVTRDTWLFDFHSTGMREKSHGLRRSDWRMQAFTLYGKPRERDQVDWLICAFQTARSRLYRQLRLRAKTHFSAFFEIYKICILLHRSNLKKFRFFAKFFRVNFRISPDFCKILLIFAKFQQISAKFDANLQNFRD